MKFDKLNEMIPYVQGGKQKILRMSPYNAITLRMPGRHAGDTEKPGGDFVVCVDDEDMGWVEHQFTHTDIFLDLEAKAKVLPGITTQLMEHYLEVVLNGYDPEKVDTEGLESLPGIHPQTFLYAVQCLAVAEHRRYARYEAKFGGRYLPFRFGAGIVEGLWSAGQAIEKQKRGRPGVEWLEKDYGVPILTKELMQ
jgi:hypothetical protein